MYVGRIVAVGRARDGQMCGLYRVSSRSFPNRRAVLQADRASIIPREGFEQDIQKNPYIAYNCCRIVGTRAVVTNGSHTDMVADKLAIGLPPRDALVTVMFGMDYEHDSLNTPRISGIVDAASGEAWLGIVSDQALQVKQISLNPGEACYVATYEHTDPGPYLDTEFEAKTADAACSYILGRGLFAELERPISAVCAVSKNNGYELAARDAD